MHWLGVGVKTLLAAQLLVGLAMVVALVNQRSLVNQIIADPGSISRHDAAQADQAVRTASLISTIFPLVTAIAFVVWFHRARRNVDSWQPR